MKKLITNALFNKRGEMLIETIISIMLFSVLLIGITGIVTSATNSVRETQRESDAVQETVNLMVTRDATLTAQTPAPDITLTLVDPTDPTVTVDMTHEAALVSAEDLVYFYPTNTP